MKKHIAIIGIEQNKKQIAQSLASELDMMLFDCHDYICFNNNMSVEQLIKCSNITYLKKQVSKAICELEDLENMLFVSCDDPLLCVADLQKLREYSYVVYLFNGERVAYDVTKSCVPHLKIDELCINAHKRYVNRCDFAIDINGLAIDDVVAKICDYLKTI